jgi:hypothetical protein
MNVYNELERKIKGTKCTFAGETKRPIRQVIKQPSTTVKTEEGKKKH